jgi:hypothetical protein
MAPVWTLADRTRSRLLAVARRVVLTGLLAVGVWVGCGKFLGFGPWYYAEVRRIERRAKEIPGVEVLEVEGNHDLTLEDIWLVIRYRGEVLHFQIVTPGSFERWTENLGVGRMGRFNLSWYSYPSVERERKGDWDRASWTVDLGPGTPLADRFDPPFASIPDFLARIDEFRAFVDTIPDEWPGLRIVEPTGRIHHIRRGGPGVSPYEDEPGSPGEAR